MMHSLSSSIREEMRIMCLTRARQREIVLEILKKSDAGASYWELLNEYEQRKQDMDEVCQEGTLLSLIESMVRNNDLKYVGNKIVVDNAYAGQERG